MDRKGRGDKKALEIARTETFGRSNRGSHCLRLVQLIWVAGFDGGCASFIREKFLAALFSAAHRNLVGLARYANWTSRDVPIARRSRARSPPLADGLGNVRGARWRCRGGTPQIFWSALARRKAADPASH